MDRPRRTVRNFSHIDSKYYEADDVPPTPPPTSERSWTSRAASPASIATNTIGLKDLYQWTRSKEQPQSRDPFERHERGGRENDNDEAKEEWPRFTLKSVDEAPAYCETPVSPRAPYNHNFLHPPTPKQRSFFNLGNSSKETQQGQGGADDNDPTPGLRRRSTKNLNVVMDLDKSSRFGWWTPALLLLTALVVTLTALYANGTVKSIMQDRFFTASTSNAILVLRIMTEACALMMAGLVVVVVEDLQWALASRPEGVSLLHFVGLDGGTGVWGLVRLLATADWKEKYSSLFRLLIICSIPLPGILLMGDITLEFVFFPQHTYPVAAGVAEFDASLIAAVDDTIATALLVSMGSTSWSTKDTWSLDPLGKDYGQCTTSSDDHSWVPCAESHLLVGGVLGITPQSDDLTTFPRSTAYVVPRTRILQLEFGDVHNLTKLAQDGTCYTIGTTYAAAYWCTATGYNEELLFGSSYCPLAVQAKNECLTNTTWNAPLQISSSLFIYNRHATVSYDRGNTSVISVTDLTEPKRQLIALDDYMLALSAVVPGFRPMNDTGEAGTTNRTAKGDNSALAIYAVTALPLNDNQIAKTISLAAVRKAMSVPFNYFHNNYFSSESIFELSAPRSGLSEDMYTTLSLAVTSHQVVAGTFSRWAFSALCGFLLALSAATIVITALICERQPQRCGYPTLDFAAVCAAKGGIPRPGSSASELNGARAGGRSLHRSLTAISQKPGPFQVASRIKGEKVMLGG